MNTPPDLEISPVFPSGIRWLRSGRDLWRQQKIVNDPGYHTLAGWRHETPREASWAFDVMTKQGGEERFAMGLLRIEQEERDRQQAADAEACAAAMIRTAAQAAERAVVLQFPVRATA